MRSRLPRWMPVSWACKALVMEKGYAKNPPFFLFFKTRGLDPSEPPASAGREPTAHTREELPGIEPRERCESGPTNHSKEST